MKFLVMYKYIFRSSIRASVLLAVSSTSLFLAGCAPESGQGADPGTIDSPIAYTKRTILIDDNGNFIAQDVRRPLTYRAGGDLFIKPRSSVSATETNLTSSITTIMDNGVPKNIADVRDVESNYEGTKLVFSLRIDDPDNNNDDDNTWVIYEYDIVAGTPPTPIIPQGADPGDDIAPHYLPDGRIVFTSNRQHNSSSVAPDEFPNDTGSTGKSKFSSLDENRRTKALNLHVMEADGSNIKQISNNQSHDLDPTVLPNGRILFSRWDHAGINNTMSLYTVNPDGSDLQIYYGGHAASHPGGMQFVLPRVMQDGRVMVLTQQFRNTFGGVDIYMIDGANFIDNNQPVKPISVNPGVTGPAQVKATSAVISTTGISLGGRYSSAYPVDDGSGRFLVSKGNCQLTNDIIDPDDPNFDPNLIPTVQNCIEPFISQPIVNEMPPVYGIWMNNPGNGTELPIVLPEPGKFITDIIGVSSRTRPTIIDDKGAADLNQALSLKEGILNIRSVYDFGNGSGVFNGCFQDDCIPTTVMNNNTPNDPSDDITSPRDLYDPARIDSTDLPARYLRIVKAVGICDPDDVSCVKANNTSLDLANEAFGTDRRLGMREIVGYTMIQADGSVRVKVPADTAFYIDVLDKDGRRILKRDANGNLMRTRHDNWMQVRPKDTLECTGCHLHETGVTPLPHAREDAVEAQLHTGLEGDAIDLVNTGVYNNAGAIYFGDTGNTMAEILTRQFPAALTPSFDLLYVDVWTDPADVTQTVEVPTSVRFADLDPSINAAVNKILLPQCTDTTTDLLTPVWDARCRMVINYEDHIHPIWQVSRGVAGVDTCTNCHSKVDSADGITPWVPRGYLDLSDGLDDDDPNPIQYESYRELFFDDNRQIIDGTGALSDNLIPTNVPRVDGNGDPVLDPATCTTFDGLGNPILDPATCSQFIDVVLLPDDSNPQTPSMNPDGARANYFIEKMTGETLDVSAADRNRVNWTLTPAVNHTGMLTAAELKLISEWLDIGAQYFNNPKHNNVPVN